MIKFKEVTWYSKLAAALFFIGVLPTLTFYTGAQYGEVIGKLEMAEIFLPLPKSQKTIIATINFAAQGRLIKDNPGFKPNTWYFVYEIPGSPALYKEITFDEQSICSYNSKRGSCPDVLLPSSALIQLKGTESNGLIRVMEATTGN